MSMGKCKGINCKAVDGVGHSVECLMDHNSKHHPNAGNNNPTYRYKGYKNEPLGKATEEQQAAWWEGRKASMFPPDHSIKNKKDVLISELEASNAALREELAALKQSLAKVRADAIRDAATALCNFRGLMNTVDQDELNEHANKIEAGL